jgi:hypothetical protein
MFCWSKTLMALERQSGICCRGAPLERWPASQLGAASQRSLFDDFSADYQAFNRYLRYFGQSATAGGCYRV